MAGKALLLNPKARGAAKKAAPKKNPKPRAAAKKSAPKKRNPAKRTAKPMTMIRRTAMPSLTAAGGATALDILMGYVGRQLPNTPMTGAMGAAVKFGGAVALGVIAERLRDKTFGEQVMSGGMTVTLHSFMRNALAAQAPQIPLGSIQELEYFDEFNAYSEGNLNAYDFMELEAYSGGDLAMYSPAYVAEDYAVESEYDDSWAMLQ